MKTYILTAALSVLTLGHIAEAQDGKILTAKAKMEKEIMESLPTQDTDVMIPVTFYSAQELKMLSFLPTTDLNIETPAPINPAVVVSTSVVLPTTPKVESKTPETRRGDK